MHENLGGTVVLCAYVLFMIFVFFGESIEFGKLFCRHKYVAYAKNERFIPFVTEGLNVYYTGKEFCVKMACEKCFKRKQYRIAVKFKELQNLPIYPDIVYKAEFQRKALELGGKMRKNKIKLINQ